LKKATTAALNFLWYNQLRRPKKSVPTVVSRDHLRELLIEAGCKLADDPRLRAHVNRGMVAVLESFAQEHKGGVATFIADQIKAWDMGQLVRLIEINVGKDLQFIRFNGAIVGGLAGLSLYTGEILLQLA
jgi:uncharacterized membrane-anchored protein YjiN (DUF445 family)